MADRGGIDPLRWELMWFNGVCYRVHPKVARPTGRGPHQLTELSVEGGDVERSQWFDEPNCEPESALRQRVDCLHGPDRPDGRHNVRASVHIPDRYLGRVCGAQHSRRKEIEAETRTEISIPKKGSAEDVVITGESAEDVERCVTRLRLLVDNARSHDVITHFVSIPFTFDAVKQNLKEFQHLALAMSQTLTENMFIRERKLHLTLSCLSLHDEIEVAHASKVLHDCQDLVNKYVEEKPLNIRIRGLEIMNDDPSAVNVLYAKVFEEGQTDAGRLQDLCDAIAQRFRDSGLTVNNRANERAQLKLHITLINSKFAQDKHAVVNPTDDVERQTRDNDNATSFNAQKILQVLGNQEFGLVQLNRVELNLISQTEPGSGYYGVVTKLSLFPDSHQHRKDRQQSP